MLMPLDIRFDSTPDPPRLKTLISHMSEERQHQEKQCSASCGRSLSICIYIFFETSCSEKGQASVVSSSFCGGEKKFTFLQEKKM